MAFLSGFLLLILSNMLLIKAEESSYPDLPFSAKLKWKRLEFAQFEANALDKPVLFLIGKTWCKKCHDLVEEMEKNEEFASLSDKFAMAKAVDDETPVGSKYTMDGKYVPKIVFEDSKGNLLKKFVNEDSTNSSHMYYYKTAQEVIKTMKEVLESGDISQGFGKDYDWKDYHAGLEVAKIDNKPMMLVIHQDWCGACQKLKPKFANSSVILQLSQKFVMVNTDDDEVAKSKKYDIDGEYYPRVVFVDPSGTVLKDMWNIGTKHTHVKFYYGNEEEIAASMKRVLESYESALDRGFGKHLRWVSFNSAVATARQQQKPILIIIHKSYCGACKALKIRVKKSKEFEEMAKKFVLVNVEDDEEPDDPQFDIDGAYVPRIMFLDINGIVEPSLKNDEEEFAKVQYAYGKMKKLIGNMQRALDMGLGTRQIQGEQQQEQKIEKESKQEEKKQQEAAVESKQKEAAVDTSFAAGYEWIPLENAQKEARKSHRAIMYVIHSGWCTFSKALREIFKTSNDVKYYAGRFVMVEIQDDKMEVPDKMDIDGKYSPRIIFADMAGHIKKDLNNTKSKLNDTKFYYATAEEVVQVMYNALVAIDTDLARGFGSHLEWQTYAKGKEIAKRENKPIFLLIHRSWCAACKALKSVLADSWDISQLRVHFVMVNTEDDEEPDDNQFNVDGGYYPRIFILDSNAKVVRELHNEDVSYLKYKFSFAYEEQLVGLMNRAYRYFADKVKTNTAPPSQTEEKYQQNNEKSRTKIDPEIRKDPAKTLPSVASFEEALKQSKEQNKPILFLIHRKTCPACKAVNRMLARDEDFKTKVQNFVLFDMEDDENPELTDKYDVDGTYVPRIFFLNPKGEMWKDIWNVGTQYQQNKYYYYETVSVLRSMDKALKAFQEDNENKGSSKDEL